MTTGKQREIVGLSIVFDEAKSAMLFTCKGGAKKVGIGFHVSDSPALNRKWFQDCMRRITEHPLIDEAIATVVP